MFIIISDFSFKKFQNKDVLVSCNYLIEIQFVCDNSTKALVIKGMMMRGGGVNNWPNCMMSFMADPLQQIKGITWTYLKNLTSSRRKLVKASFPSGDLQLTLLLLWQVLLSLKLMNKLLWMGCSFLFAVVKAVWIWH